MLSPGFSWSTPSLRTPFRDKPGSVISTSGLTSRRNSPTSFNYGFAKRLELVGEFRLEVSPEVEITDPGLSLKGVLKEGGLQEKPGLSIAVEAGPLLPSTLPHEHGVGFEAIGIVSGKLAAVTLHVNGG